MVKHPLLAQVVEQSTARMPQELSGAFDRAVMSGLTMMHAPESHDLMQMHLLADGDVAENIGEGIAKMVAMMVMHTKGKFPIQVMVHAGMVLLCHALEFAAEAGLVEINNETLDKATESYGAYLLQLLGWTPERLQDVLLKQGAASGEMPPNIFAMPKEQGDDKGAGLIARERNKE